MGVKEEHLALTSGVELAGSVVSSFWDYRDEVFNTYKDEIINCIVKPNKITAIHWLLNYYQDIAEHVHWLRRRAYQQEWIYNFIKRTLKEVDLHPELPEIDFNSCKDTECAHDGCEIGQTLDEWIDYVNENHDDIDDLIKHSAFQFIFQDRNFLHDFHLELSKFIEENMDYIKGKYPKCITNKNRIKRQYFPKWMINAVFYRDKGTCSHCRCDLSNLIRTQNTKHIDHIIPLDLFGSNDASNFQLLCETCNTSKGARSTDTSSVNVPFWNL